MPTYDYVCTACNHKEEIFQSMSDKPKRTCPACKARKFKRLIGTGAAVIFKGSGFYETDYRSDSYKADQKKDTEAGSSDKKSESSSKDSSSKDSSSKNSSGQDSASKSSGDTPTSSTDD
ncbi:MAG: FmdB family transcriptional regulator [Planctomycetes bacterium]|nr:FmdB family transcriptional regulator [Planctomycetota bacterium]